MTIRHLLVAGAAIAALSLAACSTGGPSSAQLAATKADLGVDAVFDGVVNGVEIWLKTASPAPATAAKARALLAKANAARLAADAAYTIGDGQAGAKVFAFESLLIQVAALTGQPAPSFDGVAIQPTLSGPPAS